MKIYKFVFLILINSTITASQMMEDKAPENINLKCDVTKSIVNSVIFSKDGKILACGSQDGTVKLLSCTNNKNYDCILKSFDCSQPIHSMEYSPCGNYLAVSTKGNENLDRRIYSWGLVKILDINPQSKTYGNIIKEFWLDGGLISITYILDGEYLAASSSLPVRTGSYYVSHPQPLSLLPTNKSNAPLKDINHYCPANKLLFIPDKFFISFLNNRIRINDTENKLNLQSLEENGHKMPITDIKFSPDRKNITTASHDGTIKIWDIIGNCLKTYGVYSLIHNVGITTIEYNCDGKYLASGDSEGIIKIWKIENDKCVQEFRQKFDDYHNRRFNHKLITSLSFSPDNCLAAAYNDGSIKTWQI